MIPDLIPSEASIQDSCCVVIDVLRATTTMITALGNGAQSITPVLTVEVAREVARNTNGLLGGERDCVKLPGFDFGNSPAEYTAERVGGQRQSQGEHANTMQAAVGISIVDRLQA